MDKEALTASRTRTTTRTSPEGTPILRQGGTLGPLVGNQTRHQTQAQQEQGTKLANEDGNQSNARKRSHFMRMARKLQKKGFEMTCPAEF